jgi:hypothetical protein
LRVLTLVLVQPGGTEIHLSLSNGSLHRYADRIKARAVGNAGEAKRGGDRKSKGTAPTPLITPREAARNRAGLSPHQLKQAIRVANVPAEAIRNSS